MARHERFRLVVCRLNPLVQSNLAISESIQLEGIASAVHCRMSGSFFTSARQSPRYPTEIFLT